MTGNVSNLQHINDHDDRQCQQPATHQQDGDHQTGSVGINEAPQIKAGGSGSCCTGIDHQHIG